VNADLDAIIIGGGPAGLAAAQVLGRQRRRVVLVDDQRYRNAAALSVHMVLGREGLAPWELVQAGRKELQAFPTVAVLTAEAAAVVIDDAVVVWTASGIELAASNLILATGLVDQLPPIPGAADAYGRLLFHCPLCEGFEVRDRRLVVVGDSDRAAFMAAYVHDRLSDTVSICCNGGATFSPETRRKLLAIGVCVLEAPVESIEVEHEMLCLDLRGVGRFAYDAGFLPATYRQRSPLAQGLGCVMGQDGRVEVDLFQRTSVPHVFAVGDMAKPKWTSGNMTFTATAIASGLAAAAFLDEQLFATSWHSAVPNHRGGSQSRACS
jgi:thioredoxin reductase